VIAPESGIGGLADDTALSERIRQGDRVAENELVGLYSGRVFAMAMVRVRDREATRELVDDVLMATVTALRRGTVHDTARLGAFIHGTALNLIHNLLRARCRLPRTEVLADESSTPDLAEACEKDSDLEAVRTCVGRLHTRDQQILFMSLAQGLKPGEIAARLGISAEVVRQQKCRALKRLKEMMNGVSRIELHEPHSNR
jgi:RNA polymerase sigma factor (sigma-70 family)